MNAALVIYQWINFFLSAFFFKKKTFLFSVALATAPLLMLSSKCSRLLPIVMRQAQPGSQDSHGWLERKEDGGAVPREALGGKQGLRNRFCHQSKTQQILCQVPGKDRGILAKPVLHRTTARGWDYNMLFYMAFPSRAP